MGETLLTEERISELLRDNYNIITKSISRINRGSACLFEIVSIDNRKYVFKEFEEKHSKESVLREIAVINHLYREGIKVPEYIPTIFGEYSIDENNHVIIVQGFIDGDVLEQNMGNYAQTIESAKYLGIIVKSLETLDYKLPIRDVSSWYEKETFEESVKNHQELLDKCTNNEVKGYLKSKIEMLENIRINIQDIENITYKNVHGDYSVMQFLYKNGKINAVLDFATAAYMPVILEIARSYSYIDEKCKNGEFDLDNFVDYVKEFSKYVKINKYDLEYMPRLYMIQLLNSTYGFRQYINNPNRKDMLNFARLRYNIIKYLYDNSNVIAEKLLREIR